MTSMTEIVYEGRTLTIERDSITVQSMAEPDPAWTFTDAAGHEHRASGEGIHSMIATPVTYPTLETVYGDESWCEDCRETHTDEWWACRRCGEKIVPGIRAGVSRTLPGMVTYEIDGEPVSPVAARDFVTAWQRELNARHGHDAAAVRTANIMANGIKSMINREGRS